MKKIEEDENYLGWGYPRERRELKDRKAIDKAVLRAADSLGFDYKLLFTWANSYEGRWFGESIDSYANESDVLERAESRARQTMINMLETIAKGEWHETQAEDRIVANNYAVQFDHALGVDQFQTSAA